MRTVFFAVALALVSPILAFAQGVEEVADPPQVGVADEVGRWDAILLLTRQPERFLRSWNSVPRPPFEPKTHATHRVARGEPAVAFILFSGEVPAATGLGDVRADFKVLQPDGSDYAELEDAELWNGQGASPPGALQLGATSLGLVTEAEDPLGVYTIQARVCDTVAGRCLDLEHSLEIVSPEAALDLGEFLHHYYLDPRPVLVEQALLKLSAEKLLVDADARPPLIGFFAMVLLDNPDFLPRWTAVMEGLEVHTRETLRAAIALSKAPTALTIEESPSPARNDMLWGAFFATGKAEYVRAIVDRMQHLGERKHRNLFLTAASAQWSLCVNAKGHPAVAQILRDLHASGDTWRQEIDDALAKTPGELSAATEEVLRLQREHGIW